MSQFCMTRFLHDITFLYDKNTGVFHKPQLMFFSMHVCVNTISNHKEEMMYYTIWFIRPTFHCSQPCSGILLPPSTFSPPTLSEFIPLSSLVALSLFHLLSYLSLKSLSTQSTAIPYTTLAPIQSPLNPTGELT